MLTNEKRKKMEEEIVILGRISLVITGMGIGVYLPKALTGDLMAIFICITFGIFAIIKIRDKETKYAYK